MTGGERRRRVLHVMASGARGGGAEHLLGLLPALSRLGIECSAAVGEDGPLADRLRAAGIEVGIVSLMGSRWDPRGAWRLRRVIRAARADLVHAHGTRAAWFGGWAARAPGLPPSIYTIHGLGYRQEAPALKRRALVAAERFACRASAGVVSVSRADLEDVIGRGFVSRERTLHLPNAVDAARFAPGDRAAARRSLGLPEAGFVAGTVSRLVPQKSVADLIDAVAGMPDVHLAIAGDGPLRRDLEARARLLGGRVVFLGEREDVPEVLRALDVFVLSSRWEGEPIVLLEALAAGVPVIATATEGSREVVKHTGGGRLVAIGSPPALAAAIASLRDRPEERRAIAEQGLFAVQGRTYDFSARRLAPFYERILGSSPSDAPASADGPSRSQPRG